MKRGEPRALKALSDILRSGGIAILPCDTIYGFVGKAPDTDARIREAKGRGETKPFLRLAPSVEEAATYSAEPLDPTLAALWPGKVSIILKDGSGQTTAVRVPDDPFLIEAIRLSGCHVFSTSVNVSGQAPLWKIAEIEATFGAAVDLIIDGGDLPGGQASTILDATKRPYTVVRQGALVIPPELLA
jgi:L-threonylcarbamoyladenylate synthase